MYPMREGWANAGSLDDSQREISRVRYAEAKLILRGRHLTRTVIFYRGETLFLGNPGGRGYPPHDCVG